MNEKTNPKKKYVTTFEWLLWVHSFIQNRTKADELISKKDYWTLFFIKTGKHSQNETPKTNCLSKKDIHQKRTVFGPFYQNVTLVLLPSI